MKKSELKQLIRECLLETIVNDDHIFDQSQIRWLKKNDFERLDAHHFRKSGGYADAVIVANLGDRVNPEYTVEYSSEYGSDEEVFTSKNFNDIIQWAESTNWGGLFSLTEALQLKRSGDKIVAVSDLQDEDEDEEDEMDEVIVNDNDYSVVEVVKDYQWWKMKGTNNKNGYPLLSSLLRQASKMGYTKYKLGNKVQVIPEKYRVISEAIQLKRYDDKIVAVSDLPDRKSASNETFRNKDKLKAAGFRWDDKLNSWTISKYKLTDAQSAIAKINKSVVTKLIAAVEDLPEFVMDSDNVSRKTELAKKIDGFVDELGAKASEAAVSEDVKQFLEFNKKFRKFSLNNTLLIYIQKPEATRVAGFRQWEQKFNRRVKKGAKGITIFAPISHKEEQEIDDTGLDVAVKQHYVYRFRAVTVFDISDTEVITGKEDLANVKTPEWHSDNTPNETADKLSEYASELAQELNVKMTSKESERGEQGYTTGEHINLSSNIAGVNKIATFIHEIAHSLMHFDKTSIFYVGEEDAGNRAKKELQAETVSYVVLRHYDIPVQHHATYIALWNRNKDVAAAVKENLQLIRTVSNFIIDKLDAIANEKK